MNKEATTSQREFEIYELLRQTALDDSILVREDDWRRIETEAKVLWPDLGRKIYERKCPLADKLKAGFGNRILAVEWETGKALEFPVNLYIQGIDTLGILHQISDIVSEQLNVYIRKIFIETMDGLFEGHIQLYVHDVEDVNTIISNLLKMEEMKKVIRVERFEDKP